MQEIRILLPCQRVRRAGVYYYLAIRHRARVWIRKKGGFCQKGWRKNGCRRGLELRQKWQFYVLEGGALVAFQIKPANQDFALLRPMA